MELKAKERKTRSPIQWRSQKFKLGGARMLPNF